ncbi:MAG TPA: hypothetical protein VFF36_02080, partial [Planctomycetota bacterium]|nr:hypothetical protein [Planctomycetota bacterium]
TAAQAAVAGSAFEDCCLNETNDAFASPIVRERAWTSPVWYRPEGVAKLAGQLRFGKEPGTDVLDVRLRLGADAPLDPDTQDLVLRISDDEDVALVTVPAGTLEQTKPGRFVYDRKSGALAGVRALTLALRGRSGGRLRFTTEPGDLSAVEAADHTVDVRLSSGHYHPVVSRRWTMSGRNLRTGTEKR